MNTGDSHQDGVRKAIEAAGGQKQLAGLLGIRQSHISNWLNRQKQVPALRVLDVERVTGVSRTELRPDLYPREKPHRASILRA